MVYPYYELTDDEILLYNCLFVVIGNIKNELFYYYKRIENINNIDIKIKYKDL